MVIGFSLRLWPINTGLFVDWLPSVESAPHSHARAWSSRTPLAWVRWLGWAWRDSGEGSSVDLIALLCCFAGPELSAVNYSFPVLLITRFLESPLLCLPINQLCNFGRQNAWRSELIMHSIMPLDIWVKVRFQHSIPSLKLISRSDDLMIYLL